jgi:hypothetical protein
MDSKWNGEHWREEMRARALDLDRRGRRTEADCLHRAVIADARREAAQT